jgi:hypothetical protein
MPAIADGYDVTVYIKARVDEDRALPLYPALTVSLRYAARIDMLFHQAELDVLRNGPTSKDPSTIVAMEMKACEFLAKYIRSWDLKDNGGKEVGVSPDALSKMSPALFTRLSQIIRGLDVGDVNPATGQKPAGTTEEQQKN